MNINSNKYLEPFFDNIIQICYFISFHLLDYNNGKNYVFITHTMYKIHQTLNSLYIKLSYYYVYVLTICNIWSLYESSKSIDSIKFYERGKNKNYKRKSTSLQSQRNFYPFIGSKFITLSLRRIWFAKRNK